MDRSGRHESLMSCVCGEWSRLPGRAGDDGALALANPLGGDEGGELAGAEGALLAVVDTFDGGPVSLKPA